MDIERIMQLDERAQSTAAEYQRKRLAYDSVVKLTGRPFVAIVGPRGSGKTVLLRQLRCEQSRAVYLSADSLAPDDSFGEIIRLLYESYGVRALFIDEIHFVRDFPRVLKELFDFYDISVWFTSSSSLALHESAWDLSRRVLRVDLLPFSYREYLWFRSETLLAPLSMERLLEEPIPFEYVRAGSRFRDFLIGGVYPFTLAAPPRPQLFEAMLEKVIGTDVPAADRTVSSAELDDMRAVVKFIGRSPIEGINYSSVASNVGITKYRAQKYLELLERSFIVYRAFPHGTNVLKEPKVFLELPYRLIYRDPEDCIGALREEFAVSAFRHHDVDFEYAKGVRGAKTPDFVVATPVGTTVIEVGGRGKGRTQFKDLTYHRKVVAYHGSERRPVPGESIPLHCLGFS